MKILKAIIAYIGFRPRDKSKIPQGQYCYKPNGYKNGIYNITPCPYHLTINKRWNACLYEGVITEDPVFEDQCKVCGVNKEYPKECQAIMNTCIDYDRFGKNACEKCEHYF